MSYSFEDRTFSIDVEGSETAIAALDASAITMTADLSTYTTSGIQSITLSVKLPDGVTLMCCLRIIPRKQKLLSRLRKQHQ